MMKHWIGLCLLAALSIPGVSAQSKKELKEQGIRERREETRKTSKGVTVTYLESVEKYDANGNTIEKTEYDEKGDVQSIRQYTYNDKGKLEKEISLDPLSRNPRHSVTYTYSEDDRLIKEMEYNKKGELERTVEYTYENNLKREKKVTDAKGKVTEVKTYTYSGGE